MSYNEKRDNEINDLSLEFKGIVRSIENKLYILSGKYVFSDDDLAIKEYKNILNKIKKIGGE